MNLSINQWPMTGDFALNVELAPDRNDTRLKRLI